MTEPRTTLDAYAEVAKKFQPVWKVNDLTQSDKYVLELGDRVIVGSNIALAHAMLLQDLEPLEQAQLRQQSELALRAWLAKAKDTEDPRKTKESKTTSSTNESAQQHSTTPPKLWDKLLAPLQYFSEEERGLRGTRRAIRDRDNTISHLKQNQLEDLAKLVSQTKTIEEKNMLFTLMVLREKWKRQQQQIKTSKLIHGLATLGAVATLAFGIPFTKTEEQRVATAAGAGAIAALAVGADRQTKKRQAQLEDETETLHTYHPKESRQFIQIIGIVGGR